MGVTDRGGFRIRPEAPSSFYRVAMEVAYREGAEVSAIRRAINECYAEAIAELDRRFADSQDNRRQRADGERR